MNSDKQLNVFRLLLSGQTQCFTFANICTAIIFLANINTAINLYNLHSLISQCYFNNLFYSLHTLIFTIITHSCGYLIVTILVTYSCSIYLYSTFIFIRLRCLHSSWCLQIHFNSFCNLILCNT